MTTDLDDLKVQVAELRRENRNMKRMFAAAALLIGGVGIMAANNNVAVPEVLRAQSLEIVDAKGNLLSHIGLEGDACRMQMRSQSGESGITFTAADNGTYVDIMGNMYDNTCVTLGVRDDRFTGAFITITQDGVTEFAEPPVRPGVL